MGKWSPAYYDDLLHMKFRCLTYNCVDKLRKPKVEDDLVDSHPELRITHEQFIQALDVTDPFTQQLIEILVKEVATRRHSTRVNHGNARSTGTCSTRTANALFTLWETCREVPPTHPSRRSEFVFGSHVWDGDSDVEDVGMDELTPEPEPLLFRDQAPVTLGPRIGSSLREAAGPSSSTWSSTWRPLDLIFSPPNQPLEIHSPPPPPAPSTRPHSSLLSLVSARNPVFRQSSIRRPASANSVTYFRPRHRTAEFEAQTQRLRDRTRARDLLAYANASNASGSNGVGISTTVGNQAPPESFARRDGGPRSDEEPAEAPLSVLSPELPPAPMPAHAHPHSSGPSHNALRRVTSELSSLDRSMEAHRRELTAAREDFAARFRRGVSTFTPMHHRSPSPISMTGSSSSNTSTNVMQTQPRESLRAALWGSGPREEEGLPTPRSLTPESGERGPTA
ncbi:unnamed protein product [Rhizoctonia solani]|uniref:Uncharacterized protein n=1 Tax=Rhizoctonia solani TaxID=456999 RepID=A0A8H2XIB9_9AGAM|nr:unnamed protein product [Rhizoctonia solani]CAE6528206.1 unnamed protein product [Rhizoctonia solani]